MLSPLSLLICSLSCIEIHLVASIIHKKPHHALELFNLRDAQENGLSFGQFLRELGVLIQARPIWKIQVKKLQEKNG